MIQEPEPAQPETFDTPTRLMRAALVAFADRGFDGATIRDIADRANANSAMIAYYFKGKEGLYKASLHHAFECATETLRNLPPVPGPDEPGARDRALVLLRAYVEGALRTFMECTSGCGFEALDQEEGLAATILWNREMQAPSPGMSDFIRDRIQPFHDYIQAILTLLRPDLDAEARFLVDTSIQAQAHFFQTDMTIITLLRGRPYTAEDVGLLTDHIVAFSLRGMGLAPAPVPQGVQP